MSLITNSNSIVVYIIIIVITLVSAFSLYIRNSNRKRDQKIRKSFGKIPDKEDNKIENATPYHTHFSLSIPNSNRIDEITWNDLNMDDVYFRINACQSSVGEEYLYHILHELEREKDILNKREYLIDWFSNHPQERLAIQKTLLGIGKRENNGLSYYIFNAEQKKIKNSWAFLPMSLLPIVGLFIIPFSFFLGISVVGLSAGANIVTYYLNALRLNTELDSIQCFSALLFGAKVIQKKIGKELLSCNMDLDRSLRPFKKLGGMVSGNTKQNLVEFEILSIIFKAIFLVDLIAYNNAVNVMCEHKEQLKVLFEIIGETDVAIAIASFRKSLKDFCLPVFHKYETIVFTDMYHPLLNEPVTNSASISRDSIITGSNASGKSTFIKGIAVNNILAQTIHTCCARQYKLKFSYVATSMALRDNIMSGDSYFITEIKSLKRIIEFCKNQYTTCFIDEILRGTNTVERIAASTAVLKLLHETTSLCVVASHDIELTRILYGIYDNYHFSEKIADKSIEFDYLLKDGPSNSTNAIKLLEYMGFDKRIVDEATALSQEGVSS